MPQRDIFWQYMRASWNGVVDVDDDDMEEDAIVVAINMGAKIVGKPSPMDGGEWHEYLFPDGSTEWVMTRNGVGIGTSHALP